MQSETEAGALARDRADGTQSSQATARTRRRCKSGQTLTAAAEIEAGTQVSGVNELRVGSNAIKAGPSGSTGGVSAAHPRCHTSACVLLKKLV